MAWRALPKADDLFLSSVDIHAVRPPLDVASFWWLTETPSKMRTCAYRGNRKVAAAACMPGGTMHRAHYGNKRPATIVCLAQGMEGGAEISEHVIWHGIVAVRCRPAS